MMLHQNPIQPDRAAVRRLPISRSVTYGGLILALGVLLPQVFHLIGGPAMGGVMLPMHIPVLLGGFLLGPVWGMVIGAATPALSSLLFSMPVMPRLLFMVLELAAYGLFTGVFYRLLRLPSVVSLLLAMIAGRAVYFLSLLFTLNGLGLQLPGISSAWLALTDAVALGVPGMAVQVLLIPLLLAALRKGGLL